MSCRVAAQYAKCIKPIRAEEMENQLAISSYPHLKQEKARQLRKEIERAKVIRTDYKPQSTEELYNKLLRTLGNG